MRRSRPSKPRNKEAAPRSGFDDFFCGVSIVITLVFLPILLAYVIGVVAGASTEGAQEGYRDGGALFRQIPR